MFGDHAPKRWRTEHGAPRNDNQSVPEKTAHVATKLKDATSAPSSGERPAKVDIKVRVGIGIGIGRRVGGKRKMGARLFDLSIVTALEHLVLKLDQQTLKPFAAQRTHGNASIHMPQG